MLGRSWKDILHILMVGRSLRCPNCERGRLFRKGFIMNETCPYCGVRFERQPGESVGAMYLTEGLTSIVAILGYFIVDLLFHPPFVPHLIVWIIIVILFSLWAYRPSRGMWVAITYLTGGVYRDPDYEREYAGDAGKPSTDAINRSQGDTHGDHHPTG
jgi:uncharacterized protein (DUF983 family)